MTSTAHMKQRLYQAFYKAQLNDPALQKPLSVNVEAKAFEQILNPLENFTHRGLNQEHGRVSVGEMAEALRISLAEAFSKEQFPENPEMRNDMLNALQGIIEKSEVSSHGIMVIDHEDLSDFYENRSVIEQAARTHTSFMNNPGLGRALLQVKDMIEQVSDNFWRPVEENSNDMHATYTS